VLAVRLNQITIRNFRNFAHVVVPLGPGTVIVGENRAGKSNLLHAVRLVLDPTLPNSERELRPEDFWDGLSDGSPNWNPMMEGEVIEISVDIDDFESEPSVVTALSDALIEGEPMRARLTYRWSPRDLGTDSATTRPLYDWVIVGGYGREGRVPRDMRQYLFVTYLHALRDVEDDLRSWRRSPLRQLLQAASEVIKQDELDKIGQAIKEANEKVGDLEAIRDLGGRIAQRTFELVGEFHGLEAELGVAPPDTLRLIRGLRVFVDGAAHRDLGSASLGTLNVLYLALLELGLEQQLRDRLIAHVILAVDEPEAHLHPHLQRLIFRRLLWEADREQTTIVTTQSPHVASVAPPRSLVVLQRRDDRVEAVAANAADLNSTEWEDIGRYLDATRAELVFARRIVFVEGFAEQVLLPALAGSRDLDALGITICAIHGVHFSTYVRLAQALRIRWAVVTDGDPDSNGRAGDRRAGRLMNRLGISGSAPDHGIFVGRSTFEMDLFEASDDNKDAIKRVLSELATSDAVRESVSNWAAVPPAQNDLIGAIAKVGGKGRVAQRLSIERLDAPSYIAAAFDYLAE